MPSRFNSFHLVFEILSSKREETLKSLVRPARLILAVLGGFALTCLWQFVMMGVPHSVQAVHSYQPYQPGQVVAPEAYSSYTGTIHNRVVAGACGPICDYADLGVTKAVNNPAPDVGDVITYTITVTNGGPVETIKVTSVSGRTSSP